MVFPAKRYQVMFHYFTLLVAISLLGSVAVGAACAVADVSGDVSCRAPSDVDGVLRLFDGLLSVLSDGNRLSGVLVVAGDPDAAAVACGQNIYYEDTEQQLCCNCLSSYIHKIRRRFPSTINLIRCEKKPSEAIRKTPLAVSRHH